MRQQLIGLGSGAHALALQLLGNSEDAADAVHDAFETVLRRPGAFDAAKGPLKPWFLRIVRNRCIDMLRGRRPTDSRVDEIATPGNTPEESLSGVQRVAAVRAALRALDADKREIIVLRDYLDLSYAEVAAVLSIAPGTVMSRLHRARTALREVLERDRQTDHEQ